MPPALLLPVYGHDGRVCCLLQFEGVAFGFGSAVPPAVVRNLRAAAYDWRIPPAKMEERDGYFR